MNGIRQGGQLSPLLYNIYTDDLSHQLKNASTGCYIGGACVNSLSYADDMVILAPTLSSMQKLLNICHEYAEPHDIIYNTLKTVCMLVRPRRSTCDYPTKVVLGGDELSYVDSFKYLGHIISSDCRDDLDVSNQFQRQNAVGNMLVRKFSFAPLEAKIQLFKSYCYPIYCNSLWRNMYQYSIQKLTTSYSDTFKRLVGARRSDISSTVFAQNSSDHIKVNLRKSAFSLLQRLQSSSNGIINTILNSNAFLESSLRRRWHGMLYT